MRFYYVYRVSFGYAVLKIVHSLLLLLPFLFMHYKSHMPLIPLDSLNL